MWAHRFLHQRCVFISALIVNHVFCQLLQKVVLCGISLLSWSFPNGMTVIKYSECMTSPSWTTSLVHFYNNITQTNSSIHLHFCFQHSFHFLLISLIDCTRPVFVYKVTATQFRQMSTKPQKIVKVTKPFKSNIIIITIHSSHFMHCWALTELKNNQ